MYTLPQILSDELESKRRLITDNARYEQMRQMIERKWKTTARNNNGKFFCVARQSRFRNPSNPSGKLLLEGVAKAKIEDKAEVIREAPAGEVHTVDHVKHAECKPVDQAERLCLDCSVTVRVFGSPELKKLFNNDMEMELTDKVIKDLNDHPYP
ncbi:hypothetical protein J4E83_010308 [Alternaria metachromatica]|uniref:uncharacterized protein n=1 Tax=Alternaria metachromatica TaxID=283354 RepID=UPI0020C48D45|nr:uncharacterized protein J4E83_010308 [Alternaria metachromatica]KAI4606041.1 hypothetical protein J4E83_010308 [Alternaria metachromatica]